MHQIKNTFIILILFFSAQIAIISGQTYPFYNFSIDEGLSQSSVFCLQQDRNNYIWIGTDGGGAFRFNGESFLPFDTRMGLPGNIVRSIYEDSRELIWLGTDNGIAYYDGQNILNLPDSLKISNTTILDIAEDADGQIWIATNNKGIYCLHFEEGVPVKLTSISKKDGLLSNLVMDIEIDNSNQIWLALYGGINVLKYDNNNLTINSLEPGYEIPSSFVLSLHIDNKGSVWCGSYDVGAFKILSTSDYRHRKAIEIEGVNQYSRRIWKVYSSDNSTIWYGTEDSGIIKQHNNSFIQYTSKNGLIGDQFVDILTDAEGITWFASMTNGITKFIGNHFSLLSSTELSLESSINAVDKLNEDIIIGTNDGIAYLSSDPKGFQVSRREITDYEVTSLASKDGVVWAGTKENGICRISPNKKKQFFNSENGLPDNYINCLDIDNFDNIWIGTKAGICRLSDSVFIFDRNSGLINNEVQDILIDDDNRIWIATLGGLAYIDKDIYRDFDEEEGLDFKKVHSLAIDNANNIWIGTYGAGVYIYDRLRPDSTKIRNVLSRPAIPSDNVYTLEFIDDSTLIVATDIGFSKITTSQSSGILEIKDYDKHNGFIANKNQLNSSSIDSKTLWLGTSSGLLKYQPYLEDNALSQPKILLTGVQIFNEDINWAARDTKVNKNGVPVKIQLKHNENHLTFFYEAVSFRNPSKLSYQYKLDGVDKEWSPKSTRKSVTYSGLSHGNYLFQVKIVDENDKTESYDSIPAIITPPFYKTFYFYVLIAILSALLIVTYNRYRTAKLRRDKKVLKKMVDERTREIQDQKDRIEIQKNEIEFQKKELTDSITYAEKIQLALLPAKEQLDSEIENFIFFQPKDIVSGDFYWFGLIDDLIFVAIADCTGHGVPGAFMSMLGIRFLNEIVLENKIFEPDEIVESLREKVINSLHQVSGDSENKDGMDICLCVINRKIKRVSYCGANNSLYVVHKKEIEEIKADRMPVSIHPKMDKFTRKSLDYDSGDYLYLYSDGFIDQFGGSEGKKFKRGAFKNLLASLHDKDMTTQHKIMSDTFTTWLGNYDQIDDVSVMGIKL